MTFEPILCHDSGVIFGYKIFKRDTNKSLKHFTHINRCKFEDGSDGEIVFNVHSCMKQLTWYFTKDFRLSRYRACLILCCLRWCSSCSAVSALFLCLQSFFFSASFCLNVGSRSFCLCLYRFDRAAAARLRSVCDWLDLCLRRTTLPGRALKKENNYVKDEIRNMFTKRANTHSSLIRVYIMLF